MANEQIRVGQVFVATGSRVNSYTGEITTYPVSLAVLNIYGDPGYRKSVKVLDQDGEIAVIPKLFLDILMTRKTD